MTKLEKLFAEWCAARGVSAEAEEEARKAYEEALAAAEAKKKPAPKE